MVNDGGGTEARGKLVLIREYVASMRERSAALRSRIRDGSRGETATAEVLEELETAHEELAVADEELHLQRAALENIRHGLSSELRHFRDLFDHAPDGYVETDAHGVVRAVNQTIAVQLGVPAQFIERKLLINFVVRGDCDVLRTATSQLASGNAVRGLSLRFRPRHGGTPFFADVCAAPVIGPSRRVLALRWMIRPFVSPGQPSPLVTGSALALAQAFVAPATGAVTSKRLRVALDIDTELEIPTSTAGQWLPILSALFRSQVALATSGAELRIAAANVAKEVEWRVGGARLSLPLPKDGGRETMPDSE